MSGLLSADATPSTPPHSHLLGLPPSLLLNVIFPLLSARELLCLWIAAGHQLQPVLDDAVWRPRVLARGWEAPDGAGSGECMRCYAFNQRQMCVECQHPTRHMFKLLGCRLCEGCEHQHTRYALVTGLEAQQRYGLPAALLAQMPCVESCGVTLWLRDTVLSQVENQEDRDSGSESEEGDREGHEEQGLEQSQDERQLQGAVEEGGGGRDEAEEREGEEVQFDDVGPSSVPDDPRAALKAQRKAVKKQAKLDQRAKREEKAVGLLTTKGRRALTRSGGAHNTYGHEGEEAGHNTRSRGRKGSHKASVAMGSSPRSRCKVKSPWLAERERLMQEFGVFGLSGLVLAE